MSYFNRFLIWGLLLAISSPAFAEEDDTLFRYTVCTQANCSPLPELFSEITLDENQATIFETSPSAFMQRYYLAFSEKDNGAWYKVYLDEYTFNDNLPIIGFGGSFTDSAAILYQNLPADLQRKIIQLYYGADGLGYSLGRVPIASSDFSCRVEFAGKKVPGLGPCSTEASPYTYLDQEDLKNSFALQPEDVFYKIPMIKDAMNEVAKHHETLKLFASPWSAPGWMKSNGHIIHGSLLPQYQEEWAKYFINFLQAYKNYKIKFWGITVQNEPEELSDMGERFQTWQTMYFTPEQEANFVKNYLGPAIKKFEKSYGSAINIIMHDDQITSIDKKAKIINDPEIKKYVAGLGLHWYTNTDFFANKLDNAFQILNPLTEKPSRFILGTEACEGYLPWSKGPILGSWSRGEAYAHDIMNDLRHHVSGWTDWNLLLDKTGGPNWAKNYVDAPILINPDSNEIYLQPMYYYLGHFSRFIRPGAKMLAANSQGVFPLEVVSFKVPQHAKFPETVVTVVLNRDRSNRTYYLHDLTKKGNQYLNLTIPAHSIQTIIFPANTKHILPA